MIKNTIIYDSAWKENTECVPYFYCYISLDGLNIIHYKMDTKTAYKMSKTKTPVFYNGEPIGSLLSPQRPRCGVLK